MLRNTLALIMLLVSQTALAEPINKVIWLTTSDISQAEVDGSLRAVGQVPFSYFKVDEGEKIVKYWESQFPADMNSKSEAEKNLYLNQYITPHIKTYMPEIMRSKMGQSLAKFFKIKRIPAVIINDKYVTYGLTVERSIYEFRKEHQ